MHPTAGTGRVIAGRYRLTEPIGRGAMGTVWRAWDELLDRDVAVKELRVRDGVAGDEQSVAYTRTLREARTAARLSHPGVVAIYDVAEEGGRPWIVMELVEARSLDQVIATDGPLPPQRAAAAGRQLLAALAAAHSAGVLHRDVKPSNVLLADGRTVLTDFGIATFEGDARLTQTGMVMGSPGFTAPERIRGAPATPASDLWSLGATLYAAVEGHGPFDRRGGAITTMTAVINEDPPPAPSAGALGPVIDALLRRNPADRPDAATAAGMLGVTLPGASTLGRTPPSADSRPVDGPPPAAGSPPGRPARFRFTGHGRPFGMPAQSAKRPAAARRPDGTGAVAAAAQAFSVPAQDTPVSGPSGSSSVTPQAPETAGAKPLATAGPPAVTGHRTPGRLGKSTEHGGAAPTTPTADLGRPDGDPASTDDREPGLPVRDLGWPGQPRGPGYARPADGGPESAAGQDRPGPLEDIGAWTLPTPLPPRGVARRRRRLIGLGAVAVVAAAAVIAGVIVAARPTGRHAVAHRAPAGKAAADSPLVAAAQPPITGPLPAGYRRYTLSAAAANAAAGFTVAVPHGWTVISHPASAASGVVTDLQGPVSGQYLQVDLTPHTYTNMVQEAHWLERRTRRQGRFPGYRPLGLTTVRTRGTTAAAWQFSWLDPAAGRVRVLDLLFIERTAAGSQSYALYLSAPAIQWRQSLAAFDEELRTFRPLPG